MRPRTDKTVTMTYYRRDDPYFTTHMNIKRRLNVQWSSRMKEAWDTKIKSGNTDHQSKPWSDSTNCGGRIWLSFLCFETRKFELAHCTHDESHESSTCQTANIASQEHISVSALLQHSRMSSLYIWNMKTPYPAPPPPLPLRTFLYCRARPSDCLVMQRCQRYTGPSLPHPPNSSIVPLRPCVHQHCIPWDQCGVYRGQVECDHHCAGSLLSVIKVITRAYYFLPSFRPRDSPTPRLSSYSHGLLIFFVITLVQSKMHLILFLLIYNRRQKPWSFVMHDQCMMSNDTN